MQGLLKPFSIKENGLHKRRSKPRHQEICPTGGSFLGNKHEPPRIGPVRTGCLELRPSSTRIAQTGTDPVDGGGDGAVQLLTPLTRAFAAKHFHLQKAHGVDIRVTQAD